MNKLSLLLVFILVGAGSVFAQKTNAPKGDGYVFTEEFRLPATSVKNQYRSGTCWSFSALSFLESELLRTGKPDVDLSEMFVVNQCYKYKADRYVRMHGNLNFGGGGAFHDAIWTLKNCGMVPEDVYSGLNYGTTGHVHGESDAVLTAYVKAVVQNGNGEVSTAWKAGFDAVADAYLGKIPEKFNYKGKEYTPKSFAKDYMTLNPDDYVTIGSYSHHPFYGTFVLEVPDNWLWGAIYNVPVDEFGAIIDYALANKYTVAWAADVSHEGFSHTKGVAVIPETKLENLNGLEQAKWEKLSEYDRNQEIFALNGPSTEKQITQELRQKDFDNYNTTDDHGMHIVGKAKDQNGTAYYIVKNSWGESGAYKGYFYASKPFIVLQATNIMVHKDAVPKEIRKKLGF